MRSSTIQKNREAELIVDEIYSRYGFVPSCAQVAVVLGVSRQTAWNRLDHCREKMYLQNKSK